MIDYKYTASPAINSAPAVQSLEEIVRRGLDLVKELNDIRCGLGDLSDNLLGHCPCPAMEITDRPMGGARVPDLITILDAAQDQLTVIRQTLSLLTSAV